VEPDAPSVARDAGRAASGPGAGGRGGSGNRARGERHLGVPWLCPPRASNGAQPRSDNRMGKRTDLR